MHVAVDGEHVPKLVQQDVADGAAAIVLRRVLDPRLELPRLRGLERGVLLPGRPGVRGEFPEHGGIQHDESARGLAGGVGIHVGEARAAEVVHEPDAGEGCVEGPAHGWRQVGDRAPHVGKKIGGQAARARLLRKAVGGVVEVQELHQLGWRGAEALGDRSQKGRLPERRTARRMRPHGLDEAGPVARLAGQLECRLRARRHGERRDCCPEDPNAHFHPLPRLRFSGISSRQC